MPISVPPHMPIAARHQPNIDIAESIGGLGDALLGGLKYGQQRKSDRATKAAFAEPVYNADGSMNFGAMAGKIMQRGGDIDTAIALTRLEEQRNFRNQYDFMGGPNRSIWGVDPRSGEAKEVVAGEEPIAKPPDLSQDFQWDPEQQVAVPVPGSPADPGYEGPYKKQPEAPKAAAGEKPPTVDEAKQRQILHIVTPDLAIVNETWDALSDPENQAAAALTPEGFKNLTLSPGYQRAFTALESIIRQSIYSESGATAPPEEVRGIALTLVPGYHEHPSSIADKKARIKAYVDAIRIRANLPGSLENAGAPGPAQPAAGGLPPGWTQEEWDVLTPEEQRSISQ